jgi:hypothetical protein
LRERESIVFAYEHLNKLIEASHAIYESRKFENRQQAMHLREEREAKKR